MERKVISPNKNDVLCGRSGHGGKKFKHEGNRNFRLLVKSHKVYLLYSFSQIYPSCYSQCLFDKMKSTGTLCLQCDKSSKKKHSSDSCESH